MVKGVSMKLIPALVLTVFSGAASASGFQLFEQNASGIGNAYAGSAAVAENASTIYFNPAGMTQLQKLEVSGGVSVVKPSFSFNNKGSSVDGLTGTGDGGDAGGWGFVPNGYASWGVTKDLYVGIGISAPFGLKTEYDDRWVGAAQSRMFEIKTINVNPSVAYRLNEKVSLGFGLNWQKIDATYERLAGINVPSVAKLTLSDDAWGWNAGALFTLSPSTKVGISYRSSIKYKTEGHTNLNGAWLNDSKASLTLPDTAILSVTQKLSDRWEMLGDISWTGWSSIPKVDILRANGSLAQVLDTDFKDAWRVALGANYQLNSAWKLKYGIAYDQTPVRGPTTRLVSLPDNDRVWLSFGAQWAPDKAQKIDLGAAYIHVRDSKIRNDQTSVIPSRGYVAGEYSGNIWVLGAQYSYAF